VSAVVMKHLYSSSDGIKDDFSLLCRSFLLAASQEALLVAIEFIYFFESHLYFLLYQSSLPLDLRM
jgi:hypothetical protein